MFNVPQIHTGRILATQKRHVYYVKPVGFRVTIINTVLVIFVKREHMARKGPMYVHCAMQGNILLLGNYLVKNAKAVVILILLDKKTALVRCVLLESLD